MLNSIEAYEEVGRASATARNQSDEARAKFHAQHFRRMRDLEQGADRVLAAEAYARGYDAVRHVPKFEPFR